MMTHPLQRICKLWRLKATLASTVAFTFCVPYFLIGNFPLMPVRQLPLTWVDRAMGFHPYGWIWIYQSEYILVNAIPWLATRREELLRYVRGFAILSLISFAVFLLLPIRAPKPALAHPTGMYWLLQQYDVTCNSLPSLHAGMIVFTLAFGYRITAGEVGRIVKALFLIWAGLILYATLATKEHYSLDIITGILLGYVVHLWSWRHARGLAQNAQEQRTNVPGGAQVVIGGANGVKLSGQVEKIS